MEPECVIWCPQCKTDKFRVDRKPTGREGVYEHVTEALDRAQGNNVTKSCAKCGGTLERKA